MIMIHRKLIVHMQIANQASLIHRPTNFAPKAHRSSLGTVGSLCKASTRFFLIALSEERAQDASPQYYVTCGRMRDIVTATSSSKELITEQKKGEERERR